MAQRVGVMAGVLLLASSCVPSQATPTVQATAAKGRGFVSQDIPAEPTLFAAEPLLRRLDLQVAPADLPPTANGTVNAAALLSGPSFLDTARSLDDAERAIGCMTAAIYYEARSEPLAGQRAVAQVVMNRVRDRAFPSSVCGVVYQGANRATGCQFSFTCDGSLAAPRDPLSWARARNVATAALNGAVDPDVGTATHYHTTAILPWWAPSLRRIGLIGHHIFYRWSAPLERALSYRQAYAGVEPGNPMAADGDGGMADTAALLDGAAETGPETVLGVSIHRSGEAIAHGVRVHRAAPPLASAPTSVAAASSRGAGAASPLVTAPVTANAEPAPSSNAGGVQVHRGAPPAGAGAAATAG